jgi:hypothetical protein
MQCFDSEFAFDLLDKSQAADCNRFRPLRVSYRQEELPLSIGNGLVENQFRSRTTQPTRITEHATQTRLPVAVLFHAASLSRFRNSENVEGYRDGAHG